MSRSEVGIEAYKSPNINIEFSDEQFEWLQASVGTIALVGSRIMEFHRRSVYISELLEEQIEAHDLVSGYHEWEHGYGRAKKDLQSLKHDLTVVSSVASLATSSWEDGVLELSPYRYDESGRTIAPLDIGEDNRDLRRVIPTTASEIDLEVNFPNLKHVERERPNIIEALTIGRRELKAVVSGSLYRPTQGVCRDYAFVIDTEKQSQKTPVFYEDRWGKISDVTVAVIDALKEKEL